jgi:hypothetical protein
MEYRRSRPAWPPLKDTYPLRMLVGLSRRRPRRRACSFHLLGSLRRPILHSMSGTSPPTKSVVGSPYSPQVDRPAVARLALLCLTGISHHRRDARTRTNAVPALASRNPIRHPCRNQRARTNDVGCRGREVFGPWAPDFAAYISHDPNATATSLSTTTS